MISIANPSQWKKYPVNSVERSRWDNKTFHFGDSLLICIPSAQRYASAIEKEFKWLRILAPLLLFWISVPVLQDNPGSGYPWSWGIYKWLQGKDVKTVGKGIDLKQLASGLALFLKIHLGAPCRARTIFFVELV